MSLGTNFADEPNNVPKIIMNASLITSGCALAVQCSLMTVEAQPTNTGAVRHVNHAPTLPGAYLDGPNGELLWDTNDYWKGAWACGSNGWGVELSFYKTNTPNVEVTVSVGRRATAPGGRKDCISTPDGKFETFELFAPDGTLVQLRQGMSLQRDYPSNMPISEYPPGLTVQWPGDSDKVVDFGIITNGPLPIVGEFRLNSYYTITNDGEYTIRVRPVVYEDVNDLFESCSETDEKVAGTNVFERVELPTVSAKVYLAPPQ